MKIALGTVQFGINYGVTNPSGRSPIQEVRQILEFASKNGISMLDTAPSYGESEKVLGGNSLTNFNLVTKTPFIKRQIIGESEVDYVVKVFYDSLKKLGVKSLYGLIIHQISDIYKSGFEKLYVKLKQLKENGLVKKIGISVYEQSEIDYFLGRYKFDLIQLPLNVFDQRLLKTGTLSKLKEEDIEIHARSIFLQGILLAEPEVLHSQFREAQCVHTRYYEDLRANGLSLLEGALYFIKDITEIDYAVIGVNNFKQLNEIYNSYLNIMNYKNVGIDYTKHSVSNEKIIDPRKW
ncbi:aldo/keto reductase [Oceanobacillus saliphilus]|uniref:aldo/keto reductase n=1 Tax=Oceanobacillus saliphilus TaxID=2925834 RepID=UPI00201E6FC8|nr:aldo/keto reductase [Oceanobacillus saliphilus]